MSRSQNFSAEEVHMLLNCLENMKSLIAPNVDDLEFKTPAEQNKAWDDIGNIVSSVSIGTERNGKAVKTKWADLKYRTKKKAAALKNELLRTGGDSPKIRFTEIEERVLKLMGKTSIEGVTPLTFDSPGVQIIVLRRQSEKDESSNSAQFEDDNQDEMPSEVSFNSGREMSSKNIQVKSFSSTVKVHRPAIKVKKQRSAEYEDVVKRQRQTYECVKLIEARIQEQFENEKVMVKNQEKIINRLDSVVALMSEVSGHMENLNDSVNLLIQVIANKSGIQIVESE